jgi:FkbH-like protein
MKKESIDGDPGLELLLVSSFNLSNLAALLSKDMEFPRMRAVRAPFGQVMQALLDPGADTWRSSTGAALVWASPQGVSAGFARLMESQDVDVARLLGEVDQFCQALKGIPEHIKHVFIPTWTLAPFEARPGLFNMDADRGLSVALMRMNVRLAEVLKGDPRFVVFDSDKWVAVHGERSFSHRLWYMSKTPFTTELFKVAVREIKAAVRALRGETRKLLLLDLDGTLWGGVVGDVGWQNVRLGGHDAVGEAFRDFQTHLRRLRRRGVLLGIVSKNEEAIAMNALRSHSDMVLRPEDFAGWRINWRDKAQNIAELVSELNLGLQSVVFVDDNPVERARVAEALPEVLVPEWPENPMDYSAALHQLRCFDLPVITGEDRRRTEMYGLEQKRRAELAQFSSLDQWMESLEMKVSVEPLSLNSLDRATQLLNKTNQMNLTTRRLTREELWNWSRQPGNTLMVFRVSDKFGDYGLVGIASLSLQEGARPIAGVVDFILSCRVMGR